MGRSCVYVCDSVIIAAMWQAHAVIVGAFAPATLEDGAVQLWQHKLQENVASVKQYVVKSLGSAYSVTQLPDGWPALSQITTTFDVETARSSVLRLKASLAGFLHAYATAAV